LLAWIKPKNRRFMAAFVTAAAPLRPPATRDCGSVEEAKRWIEREAHALRVPVVWTDHPPKAPVC
jgi:hypothetical protein